MAPALLGGIAEPLAGLAQDGADGILRYTELLTDLTIVEILEVIESDHLGFPLGETIEHLLDFLGRGDRLDLAVRFFLDTGTMGVQVTKLGLAVPLDHLLDTGPAGHDRQVSRQRAAPLEPSQNAIIIINDGQEDLGGNVLDIGCR